MKFPILSILFWWISVVHAAVTLRQSSGRAERVLAAKRGVSSQTFSGTGTWFIPSTEGGSTGACGNYNADDAMIVALNTDQYGDTSSKSDWCGKKVKITAGSKSVTATITDACPSCGYGDLDMTQAVFEKLADLNIGVLHITWSLVGN